MYAYEKYLKYKKKYIAAKSNMLNNIIGGNDTIKSTWKSDNRYSPKTNGNSQKSLIGRHRYKSKNSPVLKTTDLVEMLKIISNNKLMIVGNYKKDSNHIIVRNPDLDGEDGLLRLGFNTAPGEKENILKSTKNLDLLYTIIKKMIEDKDNKWDEKYNAGCTTYKNEQLFENIVNNFTNGHVNNYTIFCKHLNKKNKDKLVSDINEFIKCLNTNYNITYKKNNKINDPFWNPQK